MSDPTEAKVAGEKDPSLTHGIFLVGALLFLAGAILPLLAVNRAKKNPSSSRAGKLRIIRLFRNEGSRRLNG